MKTKEEIKIKISEIISKWNTTSVYPKSQMIDDIIEQCASQSPINVRNELIKFAGRNAYNVRANSPNYDMVAIFEIIKSDIEREVDMYLKPSKGNITAVDLKDIDQQRDDYYNRPKLLER